MASVERSFFFISEHSQLQTAPAPFVNLADGNVIAPWRFPTPSYFRFLSAGFGNYTICSEHYAILQIYSFNELVNEGHQNSIPMTLPKADDTYIIW